MMKLFRIMQIAALILASLLSGCANQPAAAGESKTAPPFRLPSAQGGEVSLADYAGQPVLLYFHMAVG